MTRKNLFKSAMSIVLASVMVFTSVPQSAVLTKAAEEIVTSEESETVTLKYYQELWGPTKLENALAESATAASSSNNDGPGASAIDGNTTTLWHSNYSDNNKKISGWYSGGFRQLRDDTDNNALILKRQDGAAMTVKELKYTPSAAWTTTTGNNGRIRRVDVALKRGDSDTFEVVKRDCYFQNDGKVTLSQVYTDVKEIKVIVTGAESNEANNAFISGKRLQVYAGANETEEIPGTDLTITGPQNHGGANGPVVGNLLVDDIVDASGTVTTEKRYHTLWGNDSGYANSLQYLRNNINAQNENYTVCSNSNVFLIRNNFYMTLKEAQNLCGLLYAKRSDSGSDNGNIQAAEVFVATADEERTGTLGLEDYKMLNWKKVSDSRISWNGKTEIPFEKQENVKYVRIRVLNGTGGFASAAEIGVKKIIEEPHTLHHRLATDVTRDYWHCETCGKNFGDKKHVEEIYNTNCKLTNIARTATVWAVNERLGEIGKINDGQFDETTKPFNQFMNPYTNATVTVDSSLTNFNKTNEWYNAPWYRFDFNDENNAVEVKKGIRTVKIYVEPRGVNETAYSYKCYLYKKNQDNDNFTLLGSRVVTRATTQEDSMVVFELPNGVDTSAMIVKVTANGADSTPCFREIEIYQETPTISLTLDKPQCNDTVTSFTSVLNADSQYFISETTGKTITPQFDTPFKGVKVADKVGFKGMGFIPYADMNGAGRDVVVLDFDIYLDSMPSGTKHLIGLKHQYAVQVDADRFYIYSQIPSGWPEASYYFANHTDNPVINRWHHITAVYTGHNIDIFVDGTKGTRNKLPNADFELQEKANNKFTFGPEDGENQSMDSGAVFANVKVYKGGSTYSATQSLDYERDVVPTLASRPVLLDLSAQEGYYRVDNTTWTKNAETAELETIGHSNNSYVATTTVRPNGSTTVSTVMGDKNHPISLEGAIAYVNGEEAEVSVDSATGIATVKQTYAASVTNIPAVAATCTESGTVQQWQCAECNKKFIDEDMTTEVTPETNISIAPLGHLFAKVGTEDTADSSKHILDCERCDVTEIEEHIWLNGQCYKCSADQEEVEGTEVDTYNVTVHLGDGTVETKLGVLPGTALAVTAPAIENKTFSHWALGSENGECVGKTLRYSFYVAGDVELYAVYIDGASEVEEEAMIVISNDYSLESAGKNYVVFEATRSVPEGYTLIEHGILYGTKSAFNTMDAATLDEALKFTDEQATVLKDGVKKYQATTTGNAGMVYLKFNVGTSLDRNVHARGYMILQNTQGVRKPIYYTVTKTRTFNTGK